MTHNIRSLGTFLSLAFILLICLGAAPKPDWGFFGHRRINRMAVFTLPPELIVFYKKNIEYITAHAVDPDKRRYATRHEAVRHYIDIDHWGTYPFEDVPRNWTDVLLRYGTIHVQTRLGDTLTFSVDSIDFQNDRVVYGQWDVDQDWGDQIPLQQMRAFYQTQVLPNYYEDDWPIEPDSLNAYLETPTSTITKAWVVDHFSEYGILPYHLPKVQRKLTQAFVNQDVASILRISAEIGHYIGDAHVPLHTTTNYNGQLTDQVGIHAFWESRIPELMADKEYDYFVGKAQYLENPNDFYWNTVLASHRHVDSVLLIEKELSETFPPDQQYCYEDRLDINVRTQCPAYARAYAERMDGMVEDRMRAAILAIGSAWYTAWIDAGQPDMKALSGENITADRRAQEELNNAVKSGNIKGREHE